MNTTIRVLFVCFWAALVSCQIDDSDHLFLTTGPSSVPGGGVGVFATVDLPANEILCEYRGSLHKTPGDESKTFLIQGPDGSTHYMNGNSICSLINDCADVLEAEYSENDIIGFESSPYVDIIPPVPGLHYNARYNLTAVGKIFIFSIEPISKGAEIFYPYGKNYWIPALWDLLRQRKEFELLKKHGRGEL